MQGEPATYIVGVVVELPKPSVLIVEDERIVARDLAAVLRVAGYDVSIASSCDEALVRVSERRPDMALMDIRILGPLDGIETALILRDRFGIRAIYMSADVDPQTRMRADGTTPLGYVSKPVTAPELRAAVAAGLAARQPGDG